MPEKLAFYEATGYARLKQPQRATDAADRALSLYDLTDTTEPALVRLDKAFALAQAGEVPEACRLAENALVDPATYHSFSLMVRAQEFDRVVGSDQLQAVQDWKEILSGIKWMQPTALPLPTDALGETLLSLGMEMFTFHHCCLSVRDLDKSLGFYRCFGFRLVVLWESPDGSLRIAHMKLESDDAILELFCYASNSNASAQSPLVGNDLEVVGVKHLALKVPSLLGAKRLLSDRGLSDGTGIVHGKTGIDYFFVQDPDGLWLEIVEDDRELAVLDR